MLTFCKKTADISKMKRVLVLTDKFSETAYVCVLTYQISSFKRNSNKFLTEVSFAPSPQQNKPLKTPPRLVLNKIDSGLSK